MSMTQTKQQHTKERGMNTRYLSFFGEVTLAEESSSQYYNLATEYVRARYDRERDYDLPDMPGWKWNDRAPGLGYDGALSARALVAPDESLAVLEVSSTDWTSLAVATWPLEISGRSATPVYMKIGGDAL